MLEQESITSPVGSTTSSYKLRIIRHQQYHAVGIIQRYARGYLARKRLWSFGGKFFVYNVLKVQCAWRQYLAVKRVEQIWLGKVNKSVHRIHSLFYYWKSRRIRKIVKLTYLKNTIIKFQANVRRKLMRKKYLVLLFEYKTAKAIIIQSVIREFIHMKRFEKKKKLISALIEKLSHRTSSDMQEFTNTIKNDISLIIQQKVLEISLHTIPQLKENFMQFSLSIFYDLMINNNFMVGLNKLQYLNIYFNKLQYNLMNFIRNQKNNFNKLLHQSASFATSFSQSTVSTTQNSFSNGSTSSLLTYLQNYHYVQFLVQFLNYLTRMMLWTKYNKTRQIHFLFLEQSLGLLACQFTVMNYNYWNNFFCSSNANPFSLSSFLLFPKQLMNSTRRSFAIESAPTNLLSEYASASFSAPDIPFSIRASQQQSLNASLLLSLIQMVMVNDNEPAKNCYYMWNQNSFSSIYNIFYQITSWSNLSFVKLFDSIMLKIDLLLYQVNFQDMFEIIQGQTKHLIQSLLYPPDGINPDEVVLPDNITNRHVYNSPTPDCEDSTLMVHHGLPFYRLVITETASNAEETKVEEKSEEEITDIKEFRRLQRLKKENAKKKKVKPRKKKKSERSRLLFRIWKLLDRAREIVIPGSLESYELSYRMDVLNSLFQVAHELYVIRNLVKEFTIILDSQGNCVLPEPSGDSLGDSSADKAKQKMQLHSLKNQNKGTAIIVQIQVKVIISGPLIIVLGAIPPPPTNATSEDGEEKKNDEQSENETNKPKKKKGGAGTGLNSSQNRRHLQTYIYDKIPLYPWPLHPLVLFPHEINNIANNQRLFSVNQFSIPGSEKKGLKISRRLSSNQWLDYEKFVDYVLNEISLTFTTSTNQMTLNNFQNINLQNLSPFISTDSEPLLSFYFPEISLKRKLLLENNIMKYSVIIIQRIFRGYLGRKKFSVIRKQYLVMKRKRYLSYKVFYRLKVMYFNHQQAAIQIQRIVKGWLLRKLIKKWNQNALILQCSTRVYFAKKRLQDEKRRLFDGPQVVLMNKGGKMIEIRSQMINLFIYRCNFHYKFVGFNIINNMNYTGYLYSKELKHILREYNYDVVESLNGDSTSLYSKQLQMQLWQYEKLILFFYKYLNLLPKMNNVTTTFSNARKEEVGFYLAVCYLSGHYQGEKTDAVDSAVGWKHNYGNIYRSNSLSDSVPESKNRGSGALINPTPTLSQTLPITDQSRLQKDFPKDFVNYPIIPTVKKFKIFKEYNSQIQQNRKRRPAMIQGNVKPKTPPAK